MKSIEEAAKEYAKLEYEDLYDEDSLDVDITIKDFTKGVEFAQKWIPIEEELPFAFDHSIGIEMKLENGVVLSGYRFSDGDWLKFTEDGTGEIIKKKVTHWRPIEYKQHEHFKTGLF